MKYKETIELSISEENAGLLDVYANKLGYQGYLESLSEEDTAMTSAEYIISQRSQMTKGGLASDLSSVISSYFGIKEQETAKAVIEALNEAIVVTAEFINEE